MQEIIKNNRLFKGLSAEDTEYALRFFDAAEQKFRKGAFFKRPEESAPRFGLVLSGSLQVYMDEPDGSRMVMATLGPGVIFAQAMAYLKKKEPVYIVATSEAKVLAMSPDRVCRPSKDPRDAVLSARFTSMLAETTLSMNRRIQVLSKLTIREKLLAFFAEVPGFSEGKTVELTLNREDMAAYLGVNRSALSRELSCLKKEGRIDYYRNSFRLLKDREA